MLCKNPVTHEGSIEIFGINDEMLADTNRFPVSSHRWYEFDLPEEECGFKTVRFLLNNDRKDRFGIYIEVNSGGT